MDNKNTIRLNCDLSHSLSSSLSTSHSSAGPPPHHHPLTPPAATTTAADLLPGGAAAEVRVSLALSPIRRQLRFILLRGDVIFAIHQLDYLHLSETPEADYT